MLHTLVRVTVRCDTAGCPVFAERVLANSSSPRALLAAVRRSLRRRDGWALASPLLGRAGDRCPQCAQNPARDAGLDMVRATARGAAGPELPPEPEPAALPAARAIHLTVVPVPLSDEATQVITLPPHTALAAAPAGAAR